MNDPILELYYGLALMQNIEDMQDYALAWADLSEIALLNDRPYLAAMCRSRAEWYGAQPTGEYIRVIDGSFSELIAL